MTQPTAVQAEQETPWFEDGTDYGRDLGTGVPDGASDTERKHQADVPRFYKGADDPVFPARPEGDDEQETAVASAPARSAVFTPPSVPGNPGGQTDNEAGGTPPGPEGSN